MGDHAKTLDTLTKIARSQAIPPEELLKAERLAGVEEMAGEVAHAINNPLAVLMGRLQMRLERGDPDPEDEVLLSLARRIDRTVCGMLELSNRAALSPTPIRVLTVIEEALRPLALLASEIGVKFETFIDPRAERVLADRELLTRALNALLANAIEAMPEGGLVRIECEELAGAAAVLLRVEDAGCGMSLEISELAFDPFFTTKPGHTGLGLTLANRVVTGHGGRLRLQSSEHSGTFVTLELPSRGGARV